MWHELDRFVFIKNKLFLELSKNRGLVNVYLWLLKYAIRGQILDHMVRFTRELRMKWSNLL